jgi:5-hydroxyisourate hydrolase
VTTLSTHVLDIELGVPAADLAVAVFQGGQLVADARTNRDGRVPELAAVEPGTYRIEFDAAAYFSSTGRQAPFLQRVSIEFAVSRGARHYHVPLLLSPYACTSYRGS